MIYIFETEFEKALKNAFLRLGSKCCFHIFLHFCFLVFLKTLLFAIAVPPAWNQVQIKALFDLSPIYYLQ